jgi:hypothetical protein
MDSREGVLREVDKRWKRKVIRSDGQSGSHMPPEIKMTKKEYQAHISTLGEAQTKKANQGLPLYRGARIKVV